MMATTYRWAEHYSACRLQLDFRSLIRMASLLGLCSGIGFIPLILFLNAGTATNTISTILFVFLLAPVIGALNGALSGMVGYPLYKWLSTRSKGQVYQGIFVGLLAEESARV